MPAFFLIELNFNTYRLMHRVRFTSRSNLSLKNPFPLTVEHNLLV